MKFFTTISYILFIVSGLKSQTIPDEYLKSAIEFTESRQYDQAIKTCDMMIELYPGDANIYYLRGVNKYLLEDYDGAIKDFDITLNINPGYTDAYLKRAKAKNGKNNFIGALIDYNNAKNENLYETLMFVAGDFFKSFFNINRNNKSARF
jgi:tetratricopeptide (TPR) repeat protein